MWDAIRTLIEKYIPHGMTKGSNDRGSWTNPPKAVEKAWDLLEEEYEIIVDKYPQIAKGKNIHQLGTLGGGNHFVEVCIGDDGMVWLMLHSGSRGVGNRIGSFFIELAKDDMGHLVKNLPDRDLAYLSEGTEHFDDYIRAVSWAQNFARMNRDVMM